MAADDVRRTRDKLRQSGLNKVEVWVPAGAKDPLKALEAVLRGQKGDDALRERVMARLVMINDLITHATTPVMAPAFSPAEAQAATDALRRKAGKR